MKGKTVAIIGAGWAGCAAAVQASAQGYQVTVFEAARTAGGRARCIAGTALDNGQHILLGAYSHTLGLMRQVGVDPERTLLRLPLRLCWPDGSGMRLKNSSPPRQEIGTGEGTTSELSSLLAVLTSVLRTRGWGWRDKVSLATTAHRWRRQRFLCPPEQTVLDLCQGLPPRILETFIDPLCVAALNTPMQRASAQVFLRVLRDGLLGPHGSSDLLLPLTDLSALFPQAALAWVQQRQGQVRLGCRVHTLRPALSTWQVNEEFFDQVILACSPWQAAPLAQQAGAQAQAWSKLTQGLTFEAITTVYAQAPGARLAEPMLALSSATHTPAQFVFDRGQLGGPAGLLAFVVSASSLESSSALLQSQVLIQAQSQLGLQTIEAVQTIVEKRATFSCTPGLQRPGVHIAPGLVACGDYIAGPYPATLEGAVSSGLAAAQALPVE